LPHACASLRAMNPLPQRAHVVAGRERNGVIELYGGCQAPCGHTHGWRPSPMIAHNHQSTARSTQRPESGDAERHQRAEGPGAELQCTHFARPHPNADRRPDGQSITGYGGDGGNQDWLAHGPELSLVAATSLPAGDLARTMIPQDKDEDPSIVSIRHNSESVPGVKPDGGTISGAGHRIPGAPPRRQTAWLGW
jgi:hypothetical protein